MEHPPESPPLSAEISDWMAGEQVSVGSLVHAFGPRSFALALIVLLAPSALPIPTGGVTHVLEIIALILAAQLLVGREELWLPRRWRTRELPREGRFLRGLVRLTRTMERVARPRWSWCFGHRAGRMAFGMVALAGTLGAFLAPPFSGLDTLPALGVVLASFAVLFRDALIAAVALAVVCAGITLEIVLGRAAFDVAASLWPF